MYRNRQFMKHFRKKREDEDRLREDVHVVGTWEKDAPRRHGGRKGMRERKKADLPIVGRG